MFPQGYFPFQYFPAEYFPKVGIPDRRIGEWPAAPRPTSYPAGGRLESWIARGPLRSSYPAANRLESWLATERPESFNAPRRP